MSPQSFPWTNETTRPYLRADEPVIAFALEIGCGAFADAIVCVPCRSRAGFADVPTHKVEPVGPEAIAVTAAGTHEPVRCDCCGAMLTGTPHRDRWTPPAC